MAPGTNQIFRVNDAGEVIDQNRVFFDAVSQAPVDRVEADNGLLHWRVLEGEVSGWSYIRGESGLFRHPGGVPRAGRLVAVRRNPAQPDLTGGPSPA